MKRKALFILLAALTVAGMLSGCMAPITPTIEPQPTPTPIDYSLYGTANYAPPDPPEDPHPLFVGARWIYRNAANYWSPQISSSGLVETEVVALVQGSGEQCYVVQTHYSNGPDELLYLHRNKNAVLLRQYALIEASGSQSGFSLNPGMLFLELPLAEDQNWSQDFKGGSVEAYVYHKEVVAIESGEVRTLRGTLPPIFTGAWRVHYKVFGSSPRLFIGPEQYLWFAPGIGVVKHVLNSVDYELAEVRLRDEVLCLNEEDASANVQLPQGGLLVVQLRGGSARDVWSLASNEPGDSLAGLGEDFYADLEEVVEGSGTYAFRFRAVESGVTTLRFARSDTKAPVEFTIHVD